MKHVRFAYDRDSLGKEFDPESSRTKQAFKDECDVNLIADRWIRTGQISHVNNAQGVFANFDDVDDYHTSMTKLKIGRAHV